MKKLLLSMLAAGATMSVFGQGQVNMNTIAAGAIVRFTNTVTGTLATNGGFLAALYWGDTAATVNNMVSPLARIASLADTATASQWGYVNTASGGGAKVLPGHVGVSTFFQVRAWSVGYASYEAALASGNTSVLISVLSGTGATPIVTGTPNDSTAVPALTAPQLLWGTGGGATPIFAQLVPVPEPSMIALGVLGLAGVLFLRRRK